MKPYWTDGKRTIYHGNCLDILPKLPKVDLVVTDPPYGIGENSRRVASRENLAKPTDYGEFYWDKSPASKESVSMAISAGEHAILWGGNYFDVSPSPGWLVWDKQNTGDFAACELAWTNIKMAVRIFRFTWNGMIRAGEASRAPRVHPTQKPVELMRWCIAFSKQCKTIIDPFMGSGTTLRAAKDLGLQCVGIELSEKYCEVAAIRLQQENLFDAPESQKSNRVEVESPVDLFA